jgi:hypothetical protein
MVDAVTLIVLVAAGEAASPTATAMVHAAREALGGAAIDVRETNGPPTDAAALAAEGAFHPDAIVELIWDEVDHRHATLRVHMARTQRWLERSMTYGPSDPVAERGRTLGLAIASILPEVAVAPASAPAPPALAPPALAPPALAPPALAPPALAPPALAPPAPPASAPPPPPPPAHTPTPTPAPVSAPAPAPAPAPASMPAPGPAERVDDQAPPRAGLQRAHLEVDLVGSGAAGIGATANAANAIGGGLFVGWFPVASLSLRLGASERAGSLDVAEASVLAFAASSGIAFHPWQASRSRPIDLALRADYLLVRQSATHFDSDDPSPVSQARWLSGVDAVADVAWLLSSDVAAMAGIGVEDLLAPTYVNVRQVRVATIPPVRLVAEVGVRLRF